MAITATWLDVSIPMNVYVFNVTGLVNGANVVTLPTPPAKGSFPPADDWTPVSVWCFPYQIGAVGNLVTPDYSTLAETAAGVVSITLYAGGATNALIYVF